MEDRETGLYYCHNRYFDASTGRWVNRDPIGLTGGLNQYGYAGGSPLGVADPSGLYVSSVNPVSVAAAGLTSDEAAVGAVRAASAPGWLIWIGRALGLVAAGSSAGDLAPTEAPSGDRSPPPPRRPVDKECGEYPDDDGFDGPSYPKHLPEGTPITQYGNGSGRYFAPVGTDPNTLSLQSNHWGEGGKGTYQEPMVGKVGRGGMDVLEGTVKSWCGFPGGGKQWYLPPDGFPNVEWWR